MSGEVGLFNALLRQRFDFFIERTFMELNPGTTYLPNWHIAAIEEQLLRCLEGETKRLIITMPPRSLKSICASVALPAWILGRAPATEIICASYSQELSSSLSRDTRRIMESPFYRRAFPNTTLKRATEDRLTTTQNGGRVATSVGGVLTGIGADIIIIDDPIKAQEAYSKASRDKVNEWYDSTLLTRLNDKQSGVIIILMQRVHEDDLVGHLLDQPGWSVLNLPAIAELTETIPLPGGREYVRKPGDVLHAAREPIKVLQDLREQMGNQMFSAQYLQNPIPTQGNILRWEWLVQEEHMPSPSPGDGVYQSWDMAFKDGDSNDYSVCTTWLVKSDHYYLMDVFRVRADFPTLLEKAETRARHWKANKILIEDTANGTPVLQSLRQTKVGGLKWTPYRPKGDKSARLSAITPLMEQGKVHVPATATWLPEFRNELLAFPNGKHDDQVDSISQFLNWHINRSRATTVPFANY